MAKKITRKDIAQKAGTSVSVVSRALNRSGYVKEEKRQKILQIARELNYIPDSVTMELQEQKQSRLYSCVMISGTVLYSDVSGNVRCCKRFKL